MRSIAGRSKKSANLPAQAGRFRSRWVAHDYCNELLCAKNKNQNKCKNKNTRSMNFGFFSGSYEGIV